MKSEAMLLMINSDTSEPLNYTNYIYDISVFGRDSYVMAAENAEIWNDLAQMSCYLYGHTAIHDYVFERLTDANIDRLVSTSGSLGKQLNNFYSTDKFAQGGITKVLQGMTITAYNLLDKKFRAGFERYCDAKMQSEDCGQWLNDTFALQSDELAAMASIDQIAADEAVTKLILANQAASVAYTCAPSVINTIGSNADWVNYIAGSFALLVTQQGFVKNISENEYLISVLCTDAVALTAIADNEQMMEVIFSSIVAFGYIVQNKLAIETIFSNVVAVSVFAQVYQDIVNGENALKSVKGNIIKIENDIVDVVGQQAAVDDVIAVKKAITEAIETLRGVTSHADLMINNVYKIVDSPATMKVIAKCPSAVEVISSNETAMTAVASSVVGVSAFNDNPTAFNIVKNKDMAIAKLAAGLARVDPTPYYSMASIAASEIAMASIAASEIAMAAILASEIAMAAILARGVPDATAELFLKICKNASIADALVDNKGLQGDRTALVAALDKATALFSKEANVSIDAGGSKTTPYGLNANNICILRSCYDDSDSTISVKYQNTNQVIYTEGKHSGTTAINQGVSIRGCTVIGAGGSNGNIILDVYTAKI